MKTMKPLLMVAFLLMANPIFAENCEDQETKVITENQIKKAISLLIKAGILDVESNQLVVKDPSVLDELDRQGHVGSGQATPSAICFKEQ